MTVTSLASQFSDVDRENFSNGNVEDPPLPSEILFVSRVGQTVWACAEFTNPSGQDGYFLIKPWWFAPGLEYVELPKVARSIKRLDIVGAPSPFGSSISQMLGEAWRFFVPAGETRRYSFFFPSEGFRFAFGNWFTDLDGIPVVIAQTGQRLWWAVGSPHAAMTEPVPQSQES